MGTRLTNLISDMPSHQRDDQVDEFLRCILSHFSSISEQKIHQLSYLSEYIHHKKYQSRIANVGYQVHLDGVRSDEIEQALENMEGVQQKAVKVAGESVDTLIIDSNLECGLELQKAEVIEKVVEDFGDTPPSEIAIQFKKLETYKGKKLGEYIEVH